MFSDRKKSWEEDTISPEKKAKRTHQSSVYPIKKLFLTFLSQLLMTLYSHVCSLPEKKSLSCSVSRLQMRGDPWQQQLLPIRSPKTVPSPAAACIFFPPSTSTGNAVPQSSL